MSSTQITFYGGIHEIGGNKFLIEDKGTKIFLDFGMQMGKVNQYFAEFVNPRICNGMGDLFEFGLLPKLKGLYRKDYAKHTGFDGNEDNEIDAVILTHAHVDHAAYIHYIRPDIPIYCSEGTKLIMQAFQDTGASEDYIIFKENFQIKKNKNGDFSRSKGDGVKYPRNIHVIDNLNFNIDSIEVNTIPIDHSLPGVCGFIFHTSNGSIGCTADIRYHGRRTSATEKFVEDCSESDIDILLCEGTRVQENFSKTELDVEKDVINIVNDTENLVVCSYPTRDLDRLLSFYNAAVQSGRDLVIDLKQAYILKLFQTSKFCGKIYPNPTDKKIKIYIPKKRWGLIDKDNFEDPKNCFVLNNVLIFDFIIDRVRRTILLKLGELKYEYTGTWRKLSDISRLILREKNSIETWRTIYPRQGFSAKGGGFERDFMSNVLEKSLEVIAYAKPDRRHALRIPYRDEYGILREYEVDFLVMTKDKIFLVETKADKDLNDPTVLLKAKAAHAWCINASKLLPLNTLSQPREFEYLLLPEGLFKANSGLGFEMFLPLCREVRNRTIERFDSIIGKNKTDK